MAPTIAGEFARKRRMMARTWGVVLGDRMLSPRGYGPLYAFEILSHRALRYAAPFLHLVALGTNIALLGEGRRVHGHPRPTGGVPARGAARESVIPADPCASRGTTR